METKSNVANIKKIVENMESKELADVLNHNFEVVNNRFQLILTNLERFERNFDNHKVNSEQQFNEIINLLKKL